MLYQRLELHLDEETRCQLEAQAAQNNQAVDEFCVEIIRQYLSSAAPTRAHNGGAVDHQGTDNQATGLVELDPVVAQLAEQDALVGALLDWIKDDAGYDEATWPEVKQAIEDNRLS